MTTISTQTPKLTQRMKAWLRRAFKQRYLLLLALPGFLYLTVLRYIPIMGLQIAFKDFKFRKGIWGSPWVGLKHFDQLFHDVTVLPAVINTLGISALKLLIGFPMPILFALMLNEIRSSKHKRILQTMSYMPHFISYSIVALMLSTLLSRTGVINDILVRLGFLSEPYLFLGEKNAFWWIASLTDVWKNLGWDSIIYFSALTSIAPEMYEAAVVDGANRAQRILRITLPSLRGTILMLLILRVGQLVNGANFDLSYLLSNPLIASSAEILPTYTLKTGITLGRFSYATAVGLVQSLTSLLLVLTTNFIVNRASGEGMF